MAALILFGGGGDLAMRMLLPSLYFLDHDGLLPEGLKIIGAARSEESAEEYVAKVHEAVKARAEADGAAAARQAGCELPKIEALYRALRFIDARNQAR